MKRLTKVKCPYCGVENAAEVDASRTIQPRRFVTCDLDQGGCDATFVLRATVNIIVATATFKIEGEETIREAAQL